MAGYPSNTIQDLSIKFFELLALGLSTLVLTPVQWFKIAAFLAMASVPWIMFLAARNFFFDHDAKDWAAVAASSLGTIYWWNSLPREMFFYGMIGFPAASYLSVLGASLLYRLSTSSPRFGWIHIGWLFFAIVILPMHVQMMLPFLALIPALLMVRPRHWTQLLLWVFAAALLSLVANSAWLIPAIKHQADDASSAIVTQLPLFAPTSPLTFLLDYIGPQGYWTFRPTFLEKGYRIVLAVLGSLGVWKLISGEKRDLGIVLASVLTVLFLVAYFGSLVPFMKAWQPLRFKVPLDIFLAVAAAYYVRSWPFSSTASTSRFVPPLLGFAAMTFLLNLAQTELSGELLLRSEISPEIRRIVDWVAQTTPNEARILFEESGDETGFVYNGTYLSSFLPHLTGRQLIGGPINLYNDRHHFAEFHSGKMFKKDPQALSDDELLSYLSLYNIGAVVAFHPASLKRLQSIPGLVTLDQRVGPIHLMKVHQPLGWFIRGEGKVEAGFNRLELSDLKGDEIILKYHWIEGLTASAATKIEPVKIADDPIPFIKLIRPPPAVTLRLSAPLF
ncbi:MAG TPA: hypothetical protein VNN13_04680 [Methylomirabilota bacterium]|nr:hypothetical protein [Methylomirabilota bacterium]